MFRFAALTVYVASLFALPATAQFDEAWLSFAREDVRILADAALVLQDTAEKDYAVGDLDGDGRDDLVVVRKLPFSTAGGLANVLLMNEGGVLVDRTVQYASASTTPGDQGFLTPTNDRDATLVDVDGDGWLDVVTAVTFSDGAPKHVSHPRVYRNLGSDANGDWLGLVYEEHRIPQLEIAGQPCWPRFRAVAAGDVTGDGAPDLYFVDSDFGIGSCDDMNDRLLVNDGTGVFVDESFARMQPAWLLSKFGTSAVIADMNGDGVNDVAKNFGRPSGTSIIYNNPSNEGFFQFQHTFYNGSGYQIDVGDLNRDGRLDVLVSDESQDRYFLNEGNDVFGRVVWGPARIFEFVTGDDDGFAAENKLADLDGDGWLDALVTDVNVDLVGGCERRLHVYHNRGGVVGGAITMREEAGTSGWRGAVGLMPDDLKGSYDVAVLDIDGDGFLDLVVGRCVGTSLYRNTLGDPAPPGLVFCVCDGSGTTAPCGNTAGAGEGCLNSGGDGARLVGAGSASASADDLVLDAAGLLPGQPALLFAGNNAVNGGNGAPFGDGLRCAGSNVVRLGVRIPNAAGDAAWGSGLAAQAGWSAGTTRRLQGWYRDPVGGPCGNGFNLTNGYEVTFVP